MDDELTLRIYLIDPPPRVRFCLRRGKSELVPPVLSTDKVVAFELGLRVKDNRPDGAPNFLGPHAQGTQVNRFLAIASGSAAGQADSKWGRVAKMPLSGITWPMIRKALASPDAIIEGSVSGMAKDGGPACETVAVKLPGWRVRTKHESALVPMGAARKV